MGAYGSGPCRMGAYNLGTLQDGALAQLVWVLTVCVQTAWGPTTPVPRYYRPPYCSHPDCKPPDTYVDVKTQFAIPNYVNATSSEANLISCEIAKAKLAKTSFAIMNFARAVICKSTNGKATPSRSNSANTYFA